MGFFDDFGDKLGGAILSPQGFAPFLSTGLAAIAGLTQDEPAAPYAQSQEYIDKVFAQNQANADREYALAQQKLAMGNGGGDGGAGAALAAARLGAKVNLAALKDKALADNIANRLSMRQGNQSEDLKNQELLLQQYQNRGQAGQQGFTDIARLLAGYRR